MGPLRHSDLAPSRVHPVSDLGFTRLFGLLPRPVAVFTFGLAAIVGLLVTGGAMQVFGPFAFRLVFSATLCGLALYAPIA